MTRPADILPEPDHMTIDPVAARLGKKRRWLESRLKEDARSETPRLQFHGYIGRTRIWDEKAYQALRSALIDVDSKSRCAVACTTSQARSGWGNAHSAFAKAQALIDRRLGRGNSRNLGASGREVEILEALVHGRKPPVPFAAVAGDYLEKHDPGPADLRNISELLVAFGTLGVHEIGRADIETFYSRRFPGQAAATVRRHMASLRAVLGHGVKMEVLEFVPPWKRPKVTKRKSKSISKRFLPGEAELLIDCAAAARAAHHGRGILHRHAHRGRHSPAERELRISV